MNKKPNKQDTLRAQAEAQLALAPAPETPTPHAEELLNELQVYQIELEMQNEELRRSQVALEESRDRYLNLYEFAPVGYLTLTREGVIAEINLTAATLLGVERKKLLHSRFDALVVPEDSDRWYHQFMSLIKHEVGRQKFELGLKHGDGSVFYARIDCLRVAADDAPQVIRLTLTDITENKRTEQALRDSERRYRNLVETSSASDWIWEVDENAVYTYVSPRIRDILGYPPEEVLGKTPFDLMPVGEAQRVASLFGAIVAAREPIINLENTNLHKDGHPVTLETSGVPIIDEEGKFCGYRGVDRDITKRIRAVEELRRYRAHLEELVQQRTLELEQKNRALETANADLESFSYSVSHDLRAPLRAIDGFVAILREDYASRLDEEGQRLFQVVSDNARKMGVLINDILAFSRAGRHELQVVEIDMAALVQEVWRELEPQRAGRAIEFRLSDLPPANGDRAAVRQVWLNLMVNAIKFSRGREPALIEVGGVRETGETVYHVRDNGAGFDMAYVNNVFDMFRRLHGADEFEGTGIGLAIVKRYITKHGGGIWAEGKPGAGATFWFTLPDGGVQQAAC